eukprot:TRINITY_DN65353_c0_g1_i1.p1 TRINITY_DN65353_c0_g1~~TRINITY_DN65353_c0_g1_i1.p1  ORF type:complete len:549 (+),score=132.97 TRINITY_DN65353_c0_g1_i1:70-1647(+)
MASAQQACRALTYKAGCSAQEACLWNDVVCLPRTVHCNMVCGRQDCVAAGCNWLPYKDRCWGYGGPYAARDPCATEAGDCAFWCILGVVLAVSALFAVVVAAACACLRQDSDGALAAAHYDKQYHAPLLLGAEAEQPGPWGAAAGAPSAPDNAAEPPAGADGARAPPATVRTPALPASAAGSPPRRETPPPWPALRAAARTCSIVLPTPGSELGFDYVTVPSGADGEAVVISRVCPSDGPFAQAAVPRGTLISLAGWPVRGARDLHEAVAALRKAGTTSFPVEVVPERDAPLSHQTRDMPDTINVRAGSPQSVSPPFVPPQPPPSRLLSTPPAAAPPPGSVALRTPPAALPPPEQQSASPPLGDSVFGSPPAPRAPEAAPPRDWLPREGMRVRTRDSGANGHAYSDAQCAWAGREAVVRHVLPVARDTTESAPDGGDVLYVQLHFDDGPALVWRWVDCTCAPHILEHAPAGCAAWCGSCSKFVPPSGPPPLRCGGCGAVFHSRCAAALYAEARAVAAAGTVHSFD